MPRDDDDNYEQQTDFASFMPMTPASESELESEREIEKTQVIAVASELGCFFFAFGKRLYGYVDVVPERFYVATVFYHIWWLPLFPVKSFVLYEYSESPDEYSGVSIPLNWKSVSALYRMAILICLSLIGLFLGAASLGNHWETFVWLATAAACFTGTIYIKRNRFASPQSAAHLATILGWTKPEIVQLTRELEHGEMYRKW